MNRTSCNSYLLNLWRRNHVVNGSSVSKKNTPIYFNNRSCRSYHPRFVCGAVNHEGSMEDHGARYFDGTLTTTKTTHKQHYSSSSFLGPSSVRMFSSTGGSGGGGKDNDDGDEETSSKVKIPEWLHKKRDEAKTHKGDNRSRGGRVGRWGQGGHGDAGMRGPAKDGRQPPPNRPQKGHPSHPSHVLDTDIPRLAARKGKSKALHDEIAMGDTGKHQRKHDGSVKMEATKLAAQGLGGADVPAGVVGSTEHGNIEPVVEDDEIDLDVAMDMAMGGNNDDVFADDEFDATTFGSKSGFGAGAGSGGSDTSSQTKGSSNRKKSKKKRAKQEEPYFTHPTLPPGYVGLGARDHINYMRDDGRILSPTNKINPDHDLLFFDSPLPTYIFSPPEDKAVTAADNNVSWKNVHDVLDKDTTINYQRLLAKQSGITLEEFQEKVREEEEEQRLLEIEQAEEDAITDPKEKRIYRMKKQREKGKMKGPENEDERRANDNPYGDDWVTNAPDWSDSERNRVVKSVVLNHRGLVEAATPEELAKPKWELFSTEMVHPESRREPKRLMGPLSRETPTNEWIDSHVALVHVQGLDPNQALMGVLGKQQSKQQEQPDMDYFKLQLHASLSNIEHRNLISKTFAKLLNVDVGHISPSSLTSAYVGFGSLNDAERLIKKYQLKSVNIKEDGSEEYPVRAFSLTKIDGWQSLFGLDSNLTVTATADESNEQESSSNEKESSSNKEGEIETTALATSSSGINEMAERVSTFLNNNNENASSVILLTQLQLPPQRSGEEYLARHFAKNADTSNITEDDILILSPTSALVKVSSPDVVEPLVNSESFDEILQRTKKSLLPASGGRSHGIPKRDRLLTLLKVERELVFDKYYGPKRSFESLKQSYWLVMEGDKPPDDLYRSHFDVIRIDYLPSNVKPKDLSNFIQPFVGEIHDTIGSVQMPSVAVSKKAVKHKLGHAYIGFDRRFEAQRILEHWSSLSQEEKMNAFGKKDEDAVIEPEFTLVKQRYLRRADQTDSGKIVRPRSERYEEDLLDDLNNWEQHVKNPQDLEDILAFGIDKDILTQQFRKLRFQNKSFGCKDQDRQCDKFESDLAPGARYAEFVNTYVQVLRNCITTPKYPGKIIEGLTYPGEEIDLEKWDGPRVWPDNWEDFVPVYDFLDEDDIFYETSTG